MEKIIGITASEGVVIGKFMFFGTQKPVVEKASSLSVALEKERFHSARREAIQTLRDLFKTAVQEAGESQAEIFEVHAMMLEDLDYIEYAENLIEREGCTAQWAVQRTGEQFSRIFSEMSDDYMRQRASDVEDISSRVVRILCNVNDLNLNDVNDKIIFAGDDLMPSQTIQLDRSKILGFATQKGSKVSHVAILSRTLGIPSVVGLGGGLIDYHNKTAVLDGDNGILWVDPDNATLAFYQQQIRLRQQKEKDIAALIGKPNQTADGMTIEINGNIGCLEDCELVKQNDGNGIGLFRSEFLYMESETFPSEDMQYEAYKKVLEAMEGKRVIIRTLDLGADKKVPYFNFDEEENPAMGFRAIRISLSQREVFTTQLRALLRASVHGKLALMFPMITSVEEVKKIKQIVAETKTQLIHEKFAVAEEIELGIMVETPAAALISDLLADEIDFFSFGTNDLTQYTLAADRMNPKVESLYDPGHLGILRLLKFATDNAHKKGKWVGVCGESAADVRLLPFYLSIGIDELSVVPSAILKLRSAMKDLDMTSIGYDLVSISLS